VVFFDITELKMAENHLEEARQEAEQRARDAEEGKRTLDAIGNSTPDAIFVKDLEGRLLYANAGLLRAVGMTADQVLGRLDTEWLLDPEEGKVVMANDRQVIESGQTQVVEEIVTDAQGPHTWLSTKSPLLNSDGEVSGLVGVARDITDSRRLEVALKQSERLYRAIGESIDYRIWVCASDGQNTYASDSFLKMVGLTQEQCSRFGWGTVLHPDDRERTIAAWQECVRTGAAWDMEHRFRGVDGRWHHVLARGLPVRDEQGRITSWAGINLDIDRLKQMEDGLKEEAIRKDDFLALLGHELRNPLVPIGNAVYLMRKVGKDPALLDNACIIIEHQLAHLTRLVDDLLDVSRIARGKIMLKNEAVDLVEIMQGVIQVYQPVFHENDLALEVSLPSKPIRIDADKARIIQVVSNLLYNSIKFTDPGGHVRLSLDVKDCEWSQIRVKDDGAGIPPELLTTIFEPFMQRRETIGRTRGGLGLGLAMAKGLVELHGGHISAHSDGPGKGAEFTVRLPLVKIVDRSEQPASAVGIIEGVRGRRILVVDDVVDAAATMKLMLELWGHTVEVAYEGKTALEKAKTFSPEVILCDIGLPGDLDGYSVARAIRKTPGADGVYMIAMTGFGSEGAKDRSQQAGFDSHMTKPVEPEALEQMLARLPDIRSE
jgi:PAS domain S-box-containing protein